MVRGNDDCAPFSSTESSIPLNQKVLNAIGMMPRNGDYQTTKTTIAYLQQAAQAIAEGSPDSALKQTASASMCSSATYLVFLLALKNSGASAEQIKDLWPGASQTEGIGPWGFWNANGPGTAEFFKETEVGKNFTSLSSARPGDFMKMWRGNGDIGGPNEAGHSVIFLGCKTAGTEQFVCFWSSNTPRKIAPRANQPAEDNSQAGGYSVRCIPRKNIKRMIFSRLDNPASIKINQSTVKMTNETLKNFANTIWPGGKADRYLNDLSKTPGGALAGDPLVPHAP